MSASLTGSTWAIIRSYVKDTNSSINYFNHLTTYPMFQTSVTLIPCSHATPVLHITIATEVISPFVLLRRHLPQKCTLNLVSVRCG